MRKLSGNHGAWIQAIAREIREAGKPASFDFLFRVVPSQFATATNDGHVTAAESGLSRDDLAGGWRIWIEETVAALVRAGLVREIDDGYEWAVEQDGLWKVKFDRSTYTIYGRHESALARDRAMLGAATEPKVTKEPEIKTGFLLTGWSEVEIEIEAGIAGVITKGRHKLQVHPLAFAIPPMTPAEQEAVRADIAEHGVRVPLTLYPDQADLTARGKPKQKVLEGRHRLQFASALDKPVRVVEFVGTELEARQYVASLNLARRHLTPGQRALAVERLYGDPARAEAKKAVIEGQKKSNLARAEMPEPGRSESNGDRWENRAVKMAGGSAAGVSPSSVRTMAEVAKAPKTAERVASGEITSISRAKREAELELGKATVETRACVICKVASPVDEPGTWGDVRRGTIVLHLKPGGSPFVNLSELDLPTLGKVHLACFKKLSRAERDAI
jgi:hypothetical protein